MHYHSNWKHDKDTVYWVKLSRAQDQGLQFWQTISNAIIVHDPVPADCIYRVITQYRDRILFDRPSTPRPAPRVTLRSRRQSQKQQQQPQQQHSESASTGVWKQTRSPSVRMKEEENLVDETDNHCLTGPRKLKRNTEHPLQEQSSRALDMHFCMSFECS